MSDLVYEEASKGEAGDAAARLATIAGFRVLALSEEARDVALALLDGGSIPRRCPEDALHIGMAAASGVD